MTEFQVFILFFAFAFVAAGVKVLFFENNDAGPLPDAAAEIGREK